MEIYSQVKRKSKNDERREGEKEKMAHNHVIFSTEI